MHSFHALALRLMTGIHLHILQCFRALAWGKLCLGIARGGERDLDAKPEPQNLSQDYELTTWWVLNPLWNSCSMEIL